MIDKKFFEKHQKKILWAINTKIGRWLFGVEKMGHRAKGKKIIEMSPNSITTIKRRTKKRIYLETQFFCRPEYGIKLGKVFFWFSMAEFPQGFVMRPAYQLAFLWLLMVIGLKFSPLVVFFGTVNTYNSPANGDGEIRYNAAANWATAHDAASGNYKYETAGSGWVGCVCDATVTTRTIERALTPFDTSNLPDNNSIGTVTLTIRGLANKVNSDNDGEDFITVVQTTQAGVTAMEFADYGKVGTTEAIDAGERKDLSGAVTNTNLIFTFNSTGRGFVSKTGYTKLALREGHDLLNHDIANPPGGWNGNGLQIAFSEDATYKPVLSVTHSVPAGGGFLMNFIR